MSSNERNGSARGSSSNTKQTKTSPTLTQVGNLSASSLDSSNSSKLADYMESIQRRYEEMREAQRRENALIEAQQNEAEDDSENTDETVESGPENNIKEEVPPITTINDGCINNKENIPIPLCNRNGSLKTQDLNLNKLRIKTLQHPSVRTTQTQNPNQNHSIASHSLLTNGILTPCRPVMPTASVSLPHPVKTKIKMQDVKQPRIMCTVDMQSHLNTPIFKSQSTSEINPRGKKLLNRALEPIADVADGQFEDTTEQEKPLKEKSIKEVFKCFVVNGVEYVVLNILGKGGSSVVYHCYDPKMKQECAVKCVDLRRDRNEVMGFINEVKALKRLQGCDRIIKLHQYQIQETQQKLYVVLEKGGRDFSQILREHARKTTHLPPFMIIYYWMQMLYAVQQMHSHGVIHSDLKPANFIEMQERLKLIDFGISSCVQMDVTSVLRTVALGTFGYISPEALCQDPNNVNSPNSAKPPKYKVGFKSDVWSLGCILYQLVYKRTPFAHIAHNHARLATIMDPNHRIEFPVATWAPRGIVECMKACLQYNSQRRPGVDMLIEQYQDYLNSF